MEKESKTLNTFQKLLEQISQNPQYNQSSQGLVLAGAVEKMFTVYEETENLILIN